MESIYDFTENALRVLSGPVGNVCHRVPRSSAVCENDYGSDEDANDDDDYDDTQQPEVGPQKRVRSGRPSRVSQKTSNQQVSCLTTGFNGSCSSGDGSAGSFSGDETFYNAIKTTEMITRCISQHGQVVNCSSTLAGFDRSGQCFVHCVDNVLSAKRAEVLTTF